jgi:DNA polymerase-3 subunit epsilon
VRPGRRRALAQLAPGAALALWLALGALGLGAALGPDGRAALAPLVASHGALALGWWCAAAALGAWLVGRLHATHVAAPARLADAARLLADDPDAPALRPEGAAAARALAEAVNRLADQRRGLRADMARLVEDASRQVALERDQLGALMAELHQSVVACNLEGRILLYNGRARALFGRLSRASGGAGGAELIGLGRSIHPVIDAALIAHARETVERGLARGEAAAAARFVTTTPAGHLLQVSLAPVRSGAADGPALVGYVLLIDDITDEHATQSRRDLRLVRLTEASRASLASMRAALDVLDYPDLDPAERERFHAVVRDEVDVMSARLAELADDAAQDILTRWPLQEMLGADLVTAAAQRIAAETGRPVAGAEVDDTLWLKVDSFAVTQALAFLAGRLGPGAPLTLRLAPAGAWAHLDLVWPAAATGDVDPAGWQTEAMDAADGGSPLAPRDVAERHGGALWLERDRTRGLAFFRFLLPPAAARDAEDRASERPDYWDFDLFAVSDAARALEDRPLADLAYTVFDTETTGLDPAGGDEILQIGAVRIVNGRLLRGERVDQLVDPGRSIPEASIAFHGVRPEMVRGAPLIAEALPAFRAFVADTVLVGHNVAFDMRFLQVKEAATGVRFDRPVLDTLLLASVAQPDETSYALEAIAARLGVAPSARHSALGDALTTAQVFLKLLPLLRQRRVVTLGEAREAAKASYHARLRY